MKILQQLTTMRADLIPSKAVSPVKRVQSPAANLRRYSEITRTGHHRLHGRLMRQARSSSTSEKPLPSPVRPTIHTEPIRESALSDKTPQEGAGNDPSGSNRSSRSRLSSMEQTSSDSLESSRMSSPTKSQSSSSPHYGLGEEGSSSKEKGTMSDDRGGAILQPDPGFRSYSNMKRLSRSLDGLFLVRPQLVYLF